MAIKLTMVCGKPKSPEWMFPCLGKSHKGSVVLFTEYSRGVELIGCSAGYYSDDCVMSQFTHLDPSEVVQLKNEE